MVVQVDEQGPDSYLIAGEWMYRGENARTGRLRNTAAGAFLAGAKIVDLVQSLLSGRPTTDR
jgi:hypothetical protein